MARIHYNSSSEKEHQELVAELKALKDTVRELSDKIDKLNISTSTGRKEAQQKRVKEEGIFRIGDTVELKTKSKYRKKGSIGKVEYIGKVFNTLRLQSRKTTNRKPQNLSHYRL